ncbi:MAG: 16S rRNA (adenine(1518)-N(6)/adenine(1519)-N(6))-dimethyltransferase RsmA [Eubacteriales bacterium]|nr:16S rRNA (adenine(1518)-N(6)/adenine(1519)-N(6))-dimethyltransferase RsmA [Eubacteriales bacterium]
MMKEENAATTTSRLLRAHDIHLKKRYGQNFLIDDNILDKIVAAAQIDSADAVIEIGPGIGALTARLADAAYGVTAVEIDESLIPALTERFADRPNVTIHCGDILKTNLAALTAPYGDRPLKIVANLPYYITTPVVMALLEGDITWSSITVMVQKEVAERMQAGPGSKAYGALSLAVQYYTTANLQFTVSPNCFVPRPAVSSAVIRLDVGPRRMTDVGMERMMFGIIRAAFNRRRKTMVNAVCKSGATDITVAELTAALAAVGYPANVRGEMLTSADYEAVTRFISEKRGYDGRSS